MNGMNFKPFIAKLLDSLSDEQVKQLYDLINSHSNNFKKRSLIDNSNLLTTSDKGIGLYTIQLDSETIKTGYLIYNDTQCVLLGYVSNSERVSEYVIDMTKKTWSMVKEFITTDYFRHEVAIRAVSVGELTEIEVDDINSASTPANSIIVSDGEGGAEWSTVGEVLSEDTEEGSAQYLLGIDSEGNVIKDELPEGIVVDQTVVEDSANAVSGGAVFDFAYSKTDTDTLLEEKANVDGNYPTMTVGVADNLTPYDEDSGDDQDEPFSFQATGTANGTQSDFSTGSIALMKEKQGNTIVVNQLIANYNFVDTSYWGAVSSSISVSNNIGTFTRTNTDDILAYHSLEVITGHKYLVTCKAKSSVAGTLSFFNALPDVNQTLQANTWTNVFGISTSLYTASSILRIDIQSQVGDTLELQNVCVFDLTQMFNGNIPQDLLDNPSHFYRYYQGSLAYNEGELVNANAQYIKCIGRNQWDEEWEAGAFDTTTGANMSGSGIRSKNLFKVIPNAICYGHVSNSGSNIWAMFYDKDMNVIQLPAGIVGYQTSNNVMRLDYNTSMLVPSNAVWCKFYVTDYGATYNHDITISLYYSGESGYDQYYPYEVLTNNDTGTEVLRSAYHSKDIKKPDGTIIRNVVEVDGGDLTYEKISVSENIVYFGTSAIPNGILYKQDSVLEYTDVKTIYPTVLQGYWTGNLPCCFIQSSGVQSNCNILFGFRNDSIEGQMTVSEFKTYMTGKKIHVGAETPTTEQGTLFSENLVIDDFGSMEYQGTNGVPQGNLIFYPVDYKAFIDTLYNYTEGTPSNIALKSDLASDKTELQGVDTQLQNAIGGTLRQCLCVKESLDFDNTAFVDLGELSWTKSDTSIYSTTLSKANNQKILNTKYNVAPDYSTMLSQDKTIYNGGTNNDIIYIHDSLLTDDNKLELSSVLLAYEKA